MTALWAKSGDDTPTVAEHCRQVRAAADAAWSAVGDDITELIPDVWPHLPKLLTVAALLHDFLKANSAFQEMLARPKAAPRQPVRHEVLAAAFLTGHPPLAGWLTRLIPDATNRWAVVWAVAGHHFKMTDPAREAGKKLYHDRDGRLTLHLGHPDVRTLLGEAAEVLGTAEVPTLTDREYDTLDDDLRGVIRGYVRDASRAWEQVRRNPAAKRNVAVLKALLAAADAAGSAVPEHEADPAVWARDRLGIRLRPEDLDSVLVRDLGPGRERIRPFQTAVGASDKPVTIVAAGCGNGKTTAAYLWAQKWAAGKKLIFTYPTTGTSTAGFGSYLAEHHNLPSDLIHGKAEVDLEAIRGTLSRNLSAKEAEEERRDEAARIDSLRVWDRKVVVCTVDTVLGLLQNQRRGVYSFPAFAASAFVFDEIHSYDRRLFGGLLRFLKEFPGVPALLMSASIPPERKRLLWEVLGDRVGKDVIPGDAGLEGHKRYRLKRRDSETECWKEVAAALSKGKKVLWVCNAVGPAVDASGQPKPGRAVQVARDAVKKCGIAPIVYHSRFRYKDRVKRQNDLIAAFRRKGPVLAVTTQVCEMSLDISADLLVTAECPLPALVQRLGRLNRYAERDDPWTALVYPFSGPPYNEEAARVELDGDYAASMTATRDLVRELGGKPCRQADVAERLKRLTDPEKPETYSAWLDDGWVTEPMPVRDGDQSITVIRNEDVVGEIPAALGKNRKFWTAAKLAPWTIPMIYRRGLKEYEWEAVGPYPVAPDDKLAYTIEEGAEWRKQ